MKQPKEKSKLTPPAFRLPNSLVHFTGAVPAPRRAGWRAILILILAGLSMWTLGGCSQPDRDDKTAAPATEKAAPERQAGVTLDRETQERMGLQMETPAAIAWQPEMKVYGQVLDPAPLTDLAMDLTRAEIALDSSQQELERAKQLKAGNNISVRAYQDAAATYAQNRAAAEAAKFKIQTNWGRKIADRTGPIEVAAGAERKPDTFLTDLREGTALIRADLPPGVRLENQAQTARIVSLAEDALPVAAACFDLLPALDAQTQEQGVLFSAEPPAGRRLLPGEAVTVFIKTQGEPARGVVVPASAILRHEGAAWVYVQTEANQFARAAIPLDRRTDTGWFVSSILSATNRIVVTGAQSVLSAELSGAGFNTGQRD